MGRNLSPDLTDANSHATVFGYDGLDLLSTTTYADSASDKETLSYDADSNIVTRLARRGDTISYAYDTLNRVCSKAIAATATACGTVPGNPTVFYSYDLAGHSVAVNSGDTIPGSPHRVRDSSRAVPWKRVAMCYFISLSRVSAAAAFFFAVASSFDAMPSSAVFMAF